MKVYQLMLMDGSASDLGKANMSEETNTITDIVLGQKITFTPEDRVKYETMCANWNLLVKFIEDFIEEDFLISMAVERMNRNREYIMKRLYQKYSTLRREREHKELGIL